METTMRVKAGLLFGLLLTLGLVGCGDSGDGGVATAGGTANPSAAAGQGKEAGLKYSQCMRENGVAAFPDPDVDDSGRVSYDIPDDIPDSVINKAEEKCRNLRPFGPGPGGPDPQRIEKVRKHSQCMRDNGIPNFPDPQDDGSRRIDFGALGLTGEDDPRFQAALKACQNVQPSPPPGAKKRNG
jgi:hypothetical protein